MDFFYLISNSLSYITPIISLCGIFIGVFYNKKLFDRKNSYIFYFFLFNTLIDISSRIYSSIVGSNLIFINIYALFSLIIFFLFLNTFQTKKNKIFDYIFYLLIAYNIYELFTINYQEFEMYQSYSNTINSIFLLILIVKQFQENINFNSIDTKIRILLLSYFSINSLLNLPLNLLINYTDDSIFLIWLFNMINSIVLYCFLIYYLWKCGKIQKP